MIKILIALFISSHILYSGDEDFQDFPSMIRGNISIHKNIVGKNFDPDLPKKLKSVSIDEIILNSELFLKNAFGDDFSAPIRKVMLDRYMGDNKEYVWCWVICYFDPENLNDAKSVKLFYVYLDMMGNPLMEIKKNK